mgnify:CR=1 FL=1
MGKPEKKGFAELLRYSHMVSPEVMGLKDGGFLAGFWLTGPDLESSTVQELEHMSDMMARAVNQLDVRWSIHFEFFRREARSYPTGDFRETTTKLIDLERYMQFDREEGHFESVQTMFVTYVPPGFEKSAVARKLKKVILGSEHESEEVLVEKQLERFEEVLKGLKDSLSLIMKVRRMVFHPDEDNPYSGTSELLESVNACVNGRWHPTRLPAFPYYLDCFLAKDCINGKFLDYDREYLQCVSLVNYPAGTFPSILSDLQTLPIAFRWSNRFLLTDMREALSQIEKKRREWVQKIRSLVSQITGIQTTKVNQDAIAMVQDLDDALQDAHSGEVAFGNHTSTVILRHTNPEVLESATREIVKVFERAGCNARVERMNNLEAFLGSLPGHGYENVRKPLTEPDRKSVV